VANKSDAHHIGALLSAEEIETKNRSFAKEAEHFNFLYDCHDCVHVDDENMRCHMEYPNEELLRIAAKRWALNEKGEIEFCKYFETA
jgi:hypothetical protein